MLPVCRPSAVYPVAVVAPPPQVGLADAPPPEVWTRIPQGTPGTLGGVGLRLLQALFAAASIAVMASTDIFPFCSAFRAYKINGWMFLIFVLPHSSYQSAMFVEHRPSLCVYLCTSRQTFLDKSPSCTHIFHWRLDHRDRNLECSMCIGRHHYSH
ncbi:CASP-like protein 5A1 isoform X2 [Aegilops tauschii subsp. strangulata]|uniref:CASP-like protein 5A1 isoform X2 n=1 Tax=Aegilops tauschii subsp. strangulata TaxID=200361 RepID=UPI001ABC4DCC|nr:CASP-like protein 5A1 isoform X2 [Aegilops tauschii subsp. strangulata]XP_044416359.1 CASP-like protein 5A1 isoform X2 [Triticum aestivum]